MTPIQSFSLVLLAGPVVYAIQMLIFLFRFGRIDAETVLQGLIFVPTGWLMALPVAFVLGRLPARSQRLWLWGISALALPVSLVGMIMGGLLGPLGIIAYGVLPMLAAATIGYILTRLVGRA
ncbi:hypothetical protein [Hoeflea poritis]|uniref:Major facilitator superfamily (MFS) profile domain-containing protein n=1 Tax=Hoeflea poritis TaxID=2993659 RepID=A0ABT4VRW8_9HYPH|nr:hypothetical protein [Hoeflea poritis]MDA4847452.1 hypothetical protein [Hoeflea poritis]